MISEGALLIWAIGWHIMTMSCLFFMTMYVLFGDDDQNEATLNLRMGR